MQPNRVLLVDDEPAILQVLKIVLERHGCVTDAARDGHDAMALLRRGPFDVIISDINMPGHGGVEFLRAVREHDLDVPVILTTGQPTLDSSSQAVEYGAFRYLVKPLLPSTIVDLVDKAAKTHELARLKRQTLELHRADPRLADRAALEGNFERGLAALKLAFQPIVCWRTRSVFAYEALVRSDEPTMASPLVFLEAAARLGRLEHLGRAIRARAGAALPPRGVNLFVNVHPLDLNDEDLYDPCSPLARIADRVVLELTEQVSLEQVPDLPGRLARLRRMGFRVALDDVGAGYAGLTTLSRYKPDIAKIDMALVRGIDTQPDKKSVVGSLVKLCAELSITVVAEGVETARERDTLQALGCELLQGYFFGKPGPAFAAVTF